MMIFKNNNTRYTNKKTTDNIGCFKYLGSIDQADDKLQENIDFGIVLIGNSDKGY